MLKKLVIGLSLVSLATFVIGQTALPPALYVRATDIATVLEASTEERQSMGVSNISNGDDYRINVIHRTVAAGPIVHDVGTELHFITGGAGTLHTGGYVVRPENGPAYIEAGLARRVSEGDAILIPEGTPHQYTAVEGSVTYLEVRF